MPVDPAAGDFVLAPGGPRMKSHLAGMKRVTMEDIARECGVTKMTVSRVLTGRSRVKSATRERVLAAASRLHYEINALAQNFNSNRSGFVGVATPFDGLLGSPYFEEVFKGFRKVLSDTGFNFALFDTNSEFFNDGAKLRRLYRQRRVDGLLIVALHTTDRFLDTLKQFGIPSVVVGEQAPSPDVCSVSCDDENGILLLAEHLHALGHRRIAFVEGPRDLATAERRRQAFADFGAARGLATPAAYFQPGQFTMRGGREAGLTLLRLRQRPTAVIAANDMMAFGVMESARELGLKVPRDLSITGFDDLPSAAERWPALTTVHQPVKEMGEWSAGALLAAIRTHELPTAQLVMKVSLIVRESAAPPATGRR